MTTIDTYTEDEVLRWEGRPAPRCYTFRHWRHSIFGFIFLALCILWQWMGLSMAATYQAPWMAWLPVPFVLIGVYFSVGHLIQARLEWHNVAYALTDRRLLAQRGLRTIRTRSLDLSQVTYFRLHRQGEHLGTLRIYSGRDLQMVLHCLEHPRRLTDLLEETIRDNQKGVASANPDAP